MYIDMKWRLVHSYGEVSVTYEEARQLWEDLNKIFKKDEVFYPATSESRFGVGTIDLGTYKDITK